MVRIWLLLNILDLVTTLPLVDAGLGLEAPMVFGWVMAAVGLPALVAYKLGGAILVGIFFGKREGIMTLLIVLLGLLVFWNSVWLVVAMSIGAI
jgi:hypothetical protein